ncbi:MAG: hypothetical protein RLZZ219_1137 [Cyanobacteriota bacterium]|jgi:transcriptional regulator with XRE-family HTH domain
MPRLAPQIPGLAGLRLWKRQRGGGESAGGKPEDPLLEVGRQLRLAREARGKSLRQLALETRISTTVLEALERGWRDRLPEATYLRTMLQLIERHLQLAPGSLAPVLPPQTVIEAAPSRSGGEGLLQRFAPGSIEVFGSWQGCVLYGALTLGLIHAINLQQQRIARANLLSLQPIAPLPEREQKRPAEAGGTLLKLYPELRPLQRAGSGLGLQALRPAAGPAAGAAATGPGVLELNLSQASAVSLRSDGGSRSELQAARGQLVLPLQPPLELRITPAPAAAEEVRWNGQPLRASGGQAGRYRLPTPPAPTPPSAPATPEPAAAQRP